jgi:hypothetical protein
MSGYSVAYYAAIVVAVIEILLAAIGAIGVEGAPLYGVSPVFVRWSTLLAGVLGAVALFLPRLQRPPQEGFEPLPPDARAQITATDINGVQTTLLGRVITRGDTSEQELSALSLPETPEDA